MNKIIFREERQKRGLTQESVAKAIQINQGWLAKIEKDYTKGSFKVIIDLATYYEIGANECALLVKEKQKILNSKIVEN